MGVKGFFQALKRFGLKVKYINLKQLRGSWVAIDISTFMYRAKYANKIDKNEKKYINYFESYFCRMIAHLLNNDIWPVFVFDGYSTQIKTGEIEKRKSIRNKNIDNYCSLVSRLQGLSNIAKIVKIEYQYTLVEEIERVIKRLQTLNKRIFCKPTITESKKLYNFLKKLNFPVIRINRHEAEGYCSYLSKLGYVDYLFTTDSDVFLFGAKKSITSYSHGKPDDYKVYNIDEIMLALEFNNRRQFVNYCILLGTDFNKRVNRNGPVTARKRILSQSDNGDKLLEKTYGARYFEILREINYSYPEYREFTDNICRYHKVHPREMIKWWSQLDHELDNFDGIDLIDSILKQFNIKKTIDI